MNYYLKKWRANTQIVNPDGNVLSLQEQIEFIEEKLDIFSKTKPEELKIARELRKEIYGESNYLETPTDASEYTMLLNNRIDLSFYMTSPEEEKGKVLASISYKNSMEVVERFYGIMERRRKNVSKSK
jgi:hypothetical protein